MTSRANPFADLSDFEPAKPSRPVPVAAIEQIAEESGFPSRKASAAKAPSAKPQHPPAIEAKPMATAPAPVETAEQTARPRRRYTTGRNRQLNIKATDETIERFYAAADAQGVPLGALLELALDALEEKTHA